MTCTLFVLISLVSSTLLFLHGFFPIVKSSHGKSTLSNLPTKLKSHNPNQQTVSFNIKNSYRKHIDKVVLLVIDGLRYDFVSSDNMPYTELMTKENECFIQVEVSSPTVTMPRLKSLMTGSVSKYIDVILNFGTTQVTGDSLLYQMNQTKSRSVFYGDDTWLKLFSPDTFVRYEGVSSFYVSDFTEVDNNVTRNVQMELQAMDQWDVMILHYLGLDHIGHIENSFSPLIRVKLREMDAIIELIHNELIQNEKHTGEKFLLVITGDHGMRDLGGHGGATKSETLVPLITLGNECKSQSNKTFLETKAKLEKDKLKKRILLNERINKLSTQLPRRASQVDVTPTLAVLLGLPIPAGNTGKLIPKLLANLTIHELLYSYFYNVNQISDDYYVRGNDVNKVLSDHYNLVTKANPLQDEVLSTISAYSEYLGQISSRIIRSSTYIDVHIVYIALIISMLGTVITLCPQVYVCYLNVRIVCLMCMISYFNTFFSHSQLTNIFVSYLISSQLNVIYNSVYIGFDKLNTKARSSQLEENATANKLIIGEQNIGEGKKKTVQEITKNSLCGLNREELTLISLMSMPILCYLSTSYIENEHNVWMYSVNTFFFSISLNRKYKSKRCIIIGFLVLHRFLRCINIKWLDEEAQISCTLSYWFQMNFSFYLTWFYTISMMLVYIVCFNMENNVKRSRGSIEPFCRQVAITMCILSAYLHKIYTQYQGLLVFIYLGSLFLYILVEFVTYFTTNRNGEEPFKMPVVITVILSALLFKPYNIILISSLYVSSHIICSLFPTESKVSILLHLCLGRVYYFLQGSTNSIATIDITAGYIGQTEYNPYIAGSLIYFNMYALNFLAIFLLFHFKHREYDLIVRLNYRFISISSTFYLFVIYLHRHHLFIWSVFSPKLLLLGSYNLGNVFVLMLLYLFSRKNELKN